MLAVYLSPVYILLNVYMLGWLLRWMKTCSSHFGRKSVRIVIVTVYIVLSTAVLTGFLLPAGTLERLLKLTGNYWLGVMLYALPVIAVADVIRLILQRAKRIGWSEQAGRKRLAVAGTVCIAAVAVLCIAGAVNARIVRTTDYEITVRKDAGELEGLNIVLAADLHMGYNVGCSQIEKMVDRINEQNPDIVVLAGDIFDNEYEALEDPGRLISILKGIKSTYGTYACYGNHDIEEKILAGFTFGNKKDKKESDVRMDAFLEKAGITLLRDEGVLVDDSFYLYGRPDMHRPGRGIQKRKTPEEITEGMDKRLPIIVIDHEPAELDELAAAGVDVDLCGHTHNGQTFPGNLTIRLMWENAYGYLQKGQMHNIVTSGVGVFGPYIRVGTKAEICAVRVEFN